MELRKQIADLKNELAESKERNLQLQEKLGETKSSPGPALSKHVLIIITWVYIFIDCQPEMLRVIPSFTIHAVGFFKLI